MAAAGQFQLDVFGEVAAALARMPEAEDDIRVSAGALQAALIDHLCDVWQQPDEGIWEVRGGREALYALEGDGVGGAGPGDSISRAASTVAAMLQRWKKKRELIHREVCAKGFNKRLNSFVQSYGSTELDASCLRIALVGFLPATIRAFAARWRRLRSN